MSGTHDMARDAAQRLIWALQRGGVSRIRDWKEDIETVAKYLGVETEGENDDR